MRALFGGDGPVHFREIPQPTITSSLAALVRLIAVAICDLDVAYLYQFLPTDGPYAVGHEFTAEVIDIGDGVSRVAVGDVVTVPFQISCGGCNSCRTARSLHCSSVPALSTYGLAPFGGGDWGGACTEVVNVPYADAMCLALPAGSDPVALASVSDNVADGYRCVAPHVRPGDEVLVLGSASVGLYAAATAQALGVRCTYVDTDPARLAVAEQLGATVIEAAADGQSFGSFAVTAECVSSAGALNSAVQSTEPGGICQSAGIHFFGVPDLDFVSLYKRGITLHTSRANARDDIPQILALVADGRLDPSVVTSNVIDIDDAPDALPDALSHKTVIRMG
jgi:threonine dehydrogenase-like Zn-dependent dehydrogenase